MAVFALSLDALHNRERQADPALDDVLGDAAEAEQEQRLFDSLNAVDLHFDLENDGALVRPLVTYLQIYITRLGLFDQNVSIRVGIALEEAISNAIHHGNLELSSELREDGSDTYHKLAQERRRRAPYMHRRVHVHARLSRGEAVFTVRDEGPGFDPAALPDPTDPDNMTRTSGRGLLLMRTFMDAVHFNRPGNELTMRKCRTAGGAA
jgi:anti-sigma regulatory factor (Ser/Thr protein kinase)